jgi:PAS domain S-box-containing protein
MLDTLLKTSEDAICVLDGHGVFRSMNNSAAAQAGGRPEDFVGQTLWTFFPPELAALLSGYVRQVIDSRKGFVTETRQPSRDGWRWHRTLIEPLHDADGKVSNVLMIARDITDQKSAQEAARRSDEHFRQLFACSPIGMTLFDARGKFLNANRAARELFGVPDVRHKLDYDLLSDPRLSADVRARLRAGESVRYEAVYDFDWVRTESLHDTTRSGVSHFDTVITPLTDGQHGTGLGYLIQVQDITERKKTEIALRESRQEFEDLLQSLEDGVWAATADGQKLLYINPAMERIFGRARAEFADFDLWIMTVHPEDVPMVRESPMQLLKTGSSDLEYRIVRPDGTIRWIRDSKAVVRDAKGNPLRIGGVMRDITIRKEAEKRARGYEHDLRSLTHEILRVEEAERTQLAVDLHDGLTQILALTRIKIGVLEKGSVAPELAQQLGDIRALLDQAVHEARALTSELCPPVLHELGLPAAAAWLAEQIKRRFGLEVRIEETPPWKRLPKATNSMLFRCLRELLVNVAKHADAGLALVRFVQSEHAVSLRVADDGRGFKDGLVPEKLPTSMDAGGFGLFSIKQRLAHLGGQLIIESQPGRGSVVRLDLPLIDEPLNDSETTS